MDVDLIFKIAAIGILVAVLNQVLSRAGRDEQAMMTTLAGLVVVLMMVVQEIAQLFTMVKTPVPPVMEGIMQIAALAVTAVLCAAVIRRGAPEAALVLVLAAGCWMLMLAAGALGSVVEAIGRLAGRAGLDSTLVEPVLKTAAISILTKVTGEVCRAAGEGGAAAFVEVAGTILALAVALPLAEGVLTMMAELLG